MREEIYVCHKCRETQSYQYNDFDEVVQYVHCQCKKPKPLAANRPEKLDFYFNQLDKYFHEKYDEKKERE